MEISITTISIFNYYYYHSTLSNTISGGWICFACWAKRGALITKLGFKVHSNRVTSRGSKMRIFWVLALQTSKEYPIPGQEEEARDYLTEDHMCYLHAKKRSPILVIKSIADQNNIWGRYAGPGRWNDPDMLEVGNRGMSVEEYQSHFSIWAVMKEVIDVNQDPLGVQARKIQPKYGLEVWAGPLSSRRVVVVFWNRGSSWAFISVGWKEIGLQTSKPIVVRDLWAHSYVSRNMHSRLTSYVVPHCCKMFILTPY
ncbi:hypothetical protein UlMin_018507 [Ulmus minor]